VRTLVSERAEELIIERGGRLYVWPSTARCCGGTTRLRTATAPPNGKEFRHVDTSGACEIYLSSGLTRLPDELHVEVTRFGRRIESYWDGCAWVV
jgi:hypothetical protein